MSVPSPRTPGWLDWYRDPSVPAFRLPAGTVDTHCHVFGPQAQFPFAPERKYTPCDAGKDELAALHARLGVSRAVVVQATCHGADNTALTDAVRAAGDRARGSRPSGPTSPEPSCARWTRRACGGALQLPPPAGRHLTEGGPDDDRREDRPAGLAHRALLRERRSPRAGGLLRLLPTPLVVDHMGRPDVTQPVDGPQFARFLRFVDTNDVWVKVTCPERLSVTGPAALHGERNAYTDVVPFGRRVVEEFGDRVLWGTDWPHPNLTGHMPDDGLLVDHVPHIAVTPSSSAGSSSTTP